MERSGQMKGKRIGFVAACALLAAWGATVQAGPPPLTLWTTQIGTSESDLAYGIALDDSGNSYITGYTEGDMGGPNQGGKDAFVVKCDSAGTVQWMRQFGTISSDYAEGIAVDGSGDSYIAGHTFGDLAGPNQGRSDAFIVRYDSGGTVQWASQIGSSTWEYTSDIAVDGSGNSYITGWTWGDLGGPDQGEVDAFIVKYDSGGTEQWRRQIGTGEWDSGEGIAVDAGGNIYITGNTRGDLGGPNQGSIDVFIVAIGSQFAADGDATLDGCVDGLDYVVWSSNYQTGTWWVQGDFNEDGIVDGLDYVIWSSNYLQGCPASVPEPASAVLLVLGALAIRRRRHSA